MSAEVVRAEERPVRALPLLNRPPKQRLSVRARRRKRKT